MQQSSGGGRKRKLNPNFVRFLIAVVIIVAAILLQPVIADKGPFASPTSAPTPTPVPTPTPTPTPPPIYDDGSDGYKSNGVYIWNNKAFELFYGGESTAKSYAAAVSSYKPMLGDAAVYTMVVPNHSEFGLPERIRNQLNCTSQRQNTLDVYNNLSNGVIPVDIYDVFDHHKNEYLYFNTDTHWAPLGAYYAYTRLCEEAGVPVMPIEQMVKTTVEPFRGYMYSLTKAQVLYDNPDHIDLYDLPFPYTVRLSSDSVNFRDLATVNAPDAGMGYSMFIWGDNALMQIKNPAGTTGRRLVFVKDSYGNAMAPFCAASFDEVHVIDFRHFRGNLAQYCADNAITDVLFFNNVMSANTPAQVRKMNSLFGL